MLIGDTLTDIEAAVAAGVRSIGHANEPGKARVLNEAGANAVVTTMDEAPTQWAQAPCRVTDGMPESGC